MCDTNVEDIPNCSDDEFWCHLSEICILNTKLCDNITDCAGAEDEAYCSGVVCRVNFKTLKFVKFVLVWAWPPALYFQTCAYSSWILSLQTCISDGVFSDTTRRSHVYLSRDGSDEPECLTQPEKTKCKKVDYILNTIILKKVLWINTIYIEDEIVFFDQLKTHLPSRIPSVERSITIACSQPCVLSSAYFGYVRFASESFHRNLVIQLHNVTITRCLAQFENVSMTFVDVGFLDSSITNLDPHETMLRFERTRFEITDITFDNALVVFISISDSVLISTGTVKNRISILASHVWFQSSNTSYTNVETQIVASHLWFELQDSTSINSQITLDGGKFCSSTFDNVQLIGWTSDDRVGSVLDISSEKLKIDFANSVVANNLGGVRLVKQMPDFGSHWIQAQITNSTFQNNSKLGSGGAVEIQFFAPQMNWPSTNFIQVENSTFELNKAQRAKDFLLAHGGALSIQSFFSPNENQCHRVYVQVQNNTFGNNRAPDGGGALFFSDKCIDTTIVNCKFHVTEQSQDVSNGIFVLARSDISIEKSAFLVGLKGTVPSLAEMTMQSPRAQIWHLDLSVQCPPWSISEPSAEFGLPRANGETFLKNAIIACTTCPAAFYVPSEGNFNLTYSTNQAYEVSVQNSHVLLGQLQCIECPPGAFCPGDEITSKPNFWGFKTADGTAFQQCPPEYCCQEAPCSGYDQCSGNRAGTLCGTCEEGYSLSMLSNNCIPNEKCNDHWLWILTVLAAVIYMLWYTFKNDVFGIPAFMVQKLCRRSASVQDDEVYYIDKGYFGIMIYFVQATAMMRLSISQDVSTINKIFSQIEAYIGLGLNVEISYFSEEVCAREDLTITERNIFKLFFFLGIYCSWGLFFFGVYLIEWVVGKQKQGRLLEFRTKQVLGLVEIMKYTYAGFSSIVFYSLACVSISESPALFEAASERSVWLYDGSVDCFSFWQSGMMLIGLLFIIPYPLMLYLGMKLLEKRKISRKSFYIGIIFPLVSIVYWVILSCKAKRENVIANDVDAASEPALDDNKDGEDGQVVYDGLKGGFRHSEGGTQYWECVLMIRRLLLSLTALIPNSMIQLSVCLALCVLFLVHHSRMYPFQHPVSNKAETLSLSLLIGTAGINLIKAFFLHFGIDPQGAQVDIMMNLALIETMFVLFLLAFILCFETIFKLNKRAKQVFIERSKHPKFWPSVWAVVWATSGIRHKDSNEQVEDADSNAEGVKDEGSEEDSDQKVQGEREPGSNTKGSKAEGGSEEGSKVNTSFVLEVEVESNNKQKQKTEASPVENVEVKQDEATAK